MTGSVCLVTVHGIGSQQIAHVALVYSPSESLAPDLGETAGALARAAATHHQYANAAGIVRLLFSDA